MQKTKVQQAVVSVLAPLTGFDAMPDSAFVRQSQLIRHRDSSDGIAPIPFSAPTLWRKVKDGTFPAPLKLSERVTAWKVSDIRRWLAAQAATQFVATGKRTAKVA